MTDKNTLASIYRKNSLETTAKILGIRKYVLIGLLKKYKLFGKRNLQTIARKKEALELKAKGYTVSQIAKKWGIARENGYRYF